MLKGLPYLKKARSDKENERFEQEVALKGARQFGEIRRNSAKFSDVIRVSLYSVPHIPQPADRVDLPDAAARSPD